MTNLPEEEPRDLVNSPADDVASHLPAPDQLAPDSAFVSYAAPIGQSDAPPVSIPSAPASPSLHAEPLLFQSFTQSPVSPPARIPHLGHLSLLALLLVVSSACIDAVFHFASRFLHISLDLTAQATASTVPLMLGTEVALYLVTFAISFVIFPLFWNQKFFTGLQWRGAVALHRFWPLAATALGCAGLAVLDEVLLPGPSNAPIEEMMRTPGAAWLMFAFGTTVAPFFEEMFFRGFLLPALCTGFDWIVDEFSAKQPVSLAGSEYSNRGLQAHLGALLILIVPYAALSPRPVGHDFERVLLVLVWGSCVAVWWAMTSARTPPNAASTSTLDANGAPQWSLAAMAVGSVLTSIPFALIHVDQQGHSLGPFLLLIVVSLILCTVRLKTRSLAASTLVHACYNFIIFSLALIGTGGFRHFDKM